MSPILYNCCFHILSSEHEGGVRWCQTITYGEECFIFHISTPLHINELTDWALQKLFLAPSFPSLVAATPSRLSLPLPFQQSSVPRPSLLWCGLNFEPTRCYSNVFLQFAMVNEAEDRPPWPSRLHAFPTRPLKGFESSNHQIEGVESTIKGGGAFKKYPPPFIYYRRGGEPSF